MTSPTSGRASTIAPPRSRRSGPILARAIRWPTTPSNVVVTEDGDGTVRALCKGIGLLANGRAGSVTYRDVVTKTADGWRIAERVAVLRRADRIPEIS